MRLRESRVYTETNVKARRETAGKKGAHDSRWEGEKRREWESL